jgi:uncharacterized SAM-binding protein YcdF (DUF218 family)
VLRGLIRLGFLAGLGAACVAAYATVRVWQQGGIDEARPVGAIVVLGAAQYNGTPSPVFLERLRHATVLYGQGYAPWFITTGGKQPGDFTTEAAVGRSYAIRQGVPADRILIEDTGRTTLESMRAVARILHEHGIADALFVSDPTHMLRVLRIARDQGVTAFGSPTSTSPIERDPTVRLEATLHELGALALYFVAGDTAPDFAPDAPAGAGPDPTGSATASSAPAASAAPSP